LENTNKYFKLRKEIINIELKLNKLEERFKYKNNFIQIITLTNTKGRVVKTIQKRLINTTNYLFLFLTQ